MPQGYQYTVGERTHLAGTSAHCSGMDGVALGLWHMLSGRQQGLEDHLEEERVELKGGLRESYWYGVTKFQQAKITRAKVFT